MQTKQQPTSHQKNYYRLLMAYGNAKVVAPNGQEHLETYSLRVEMLGLGCDRGVLLEVQNPETI